MPIPRLSVALLSLSLGLSACVTEEDPQLDEVVELDAAPSPGKEDGVGRKGLPVVGAYASTAAWTVRNQWEDRETPEAKKAGIAWDANSGLNWDEKYAKWIASLEVVPSDEATWRDTIRITTPWGKSLPSPKLDCTDATIMLRVSFAAWYRLPFFMAAGSNPTIYFGHFGVRTDKGPWSDAVKLAEVYKDFSSAVPDDLAAWPKDARLRKMHIHGKDYTGRYQDEMPFYLGAGEGTGAYLDEMHLNKRAARLIFYMQTYMGSMNVVDTNNTFNLTPEALREGDTLMYRRAPTGSGHAMVVIRVRTLEGGQMEAQDIFGNEPPAQLYVESAAATRNNFSSDEGGGPSLSEDRKTPYSRIGGGLKRWRVAKSVGGKWMNTWMGADEASWIDSTDHAAISARPKAFEALLGELPPEQQRDELLKQIELKRAHLRDNPASCSARERREQLFGKLYSLMWKEWDWQTAQVDARYRTLEDYVYAPLTYTKSRTCCWNSSSRVMHESIMEYATSLQATACTMPPVFAQTNGTYGEYEAYAKSLGRPWAAWRADEACAPADELDDVAAGSDYVGLGWCALPEQPKPDNDPDAPEAEREQTPLP